MMFKLVELNKLSLYFDTNAQMVGDLTMTEIVVSYLSELYFLCLSLLNIFCVYLSKRPYLLFVRMFISFVFISLCTKCLSLFCYHKNAEKIYNYANMCMPHRASFIFFILHSFDDLVIWMMLKLIVQSVVPQTKLSNLPCWREVFFLKKTN